MNQFHRKSLVRILTGGFFFAFIFFLHWRWPNLNWTDLGQSKPMIGQTAVMELTKKSPLLFTIHQNIFMNIFPFYFYYFDGISLEVFYAYWKVIGFAIPSTIAALLFFLQFPWAITDNFNLTNLRSQDRISYIPY